MSEESKQPYSLPEGTMGPSPIPRDHGTNQLYAPAGHPEIVARHPYDVASQAGHNVVADLTDATLYLQEHYGISTPGIANTVPEPTTAPDGGESRRTFIATDRVNGVNMFTQMSEVPRDVLLATFQAMIRYYEDAAADPTNRLYFTELNLRQCMYGTATGDETPRVYKVDIDPWLGNRAHGTPAFAPSFDQGVSNLAGELLAFTRRFPDVDVSALAGRMEGIGRAFDAYVPPYI